MELYIDGADRDALAPLLATGLFRGVTTNPLILRRAGVRLADVPDLVTWLVEHGCGSVFVQTTGQGSAEVEREAAELLALSDRVVVKVPASVGGLTAARRLADAGAPVLVTAVYHAKQALLAAEAGARWVAPYVGRMTRAGRDGFAETLTMSRVLARTGTRVLAASIGSADEVVRLAAAGVAAATVATGVAAELFDEPLTDAALAEFDAAAASLA